MPGAPAVTVVVPARDAAAVLGDCLNALAAQSGAPPYEVVVVDNGSRDSTGAVARRHPVGARVVHEPVPGSYAARNAGVAAARGGMLAFTNADCAPHESWVQAGCAALADVDVVAGRVVPRASDRPSSWERYDRALYLRQAEYVQRDGFAATANLFTTERAFAVAGGFDASLRSSGDLEWCRRAAAAGLRLGYAPTAVVQHRPRTTLRGTWALHRRLGAGWAALARRGEWPGLWRDPAMWLPLGTVVDAVAADGPPLRRRHLAPVHAVATSARLVGRLTGR